MSGWIGRFCFEFCFCFCFCFVGGLGLMFLPVGRWELGLARPRPAVTFFFAKKETHERKLLGDELNARVGPLLRSALGNKVGFILGCHRRFDSASVTRLPRPRCRGTGRATNLLPGRCSLIQVFLAVRETREIDRHRREHAGQIFTPPVSTAVII